MVVRVRADGASKAQGADILEQKEGPLAAGDVRCFYGLDYSTLVPSRDGGRKKKG